MVGNDHGEEDKGGGGGKGKEPAVDYFEELTLATGSNSSSNTAISNTGTQGSMCDLTFVPTPSVRNPPSCRTGCTVCKKEFECPRMYMSFYVICPYCKDTFLASEKASPPNISSCINSAHDAANDIPFDIGSKSISCSSATMPSHQTGTAMEEEPDTTLNLGTSTTEDPPHNLPEMKSKRSTESRDSGHGTGAGNNITIREQQPSSQRSIDDNDSDTKLNIGLSWGSKRRRS